MFSNSTHLRLKQHSHRTSYYASNEVAFTKSLRQTSSNILGVLTLAAR
uniref:Uncharacterized protein n=1 Tax=Arundo donax TaxID=35708 RepID=A0A0A9DDL2_ARUDO